MTVTIEMVGVAVAFLMQAGGVVIWATRLEGRVNLLQRWIDAHAATLERLTRVEERVQGVKDVVDEIKVLVQRAHP